MGRFVLEGQRHHRDSQRIAAPPLPIRRADSHDPRLRSPTRVALNLPPCDHQPAPQASIMITSIRSARGSNARFAKHLVDAKRFASSVKISLSLSLSLSLFSLKPTHALERRAKAPPVEDQWHTVIRSDDRGRAVESRHILDVTTEAPAVVVEKMSPRLHRLLVAITAHRFGGPPHDRRQGGPDATITMRGPRDGSGRVGEIALMTDRDATIECTEAKSGSSQS